MFLFFFLTVEKVVPCEIEEHSLIKSTLNELPHAVFLFINHITYLTQNRIGSILREVSLFSNTEFVPISKKSKARNN